MMEASRPDGVTDVTDMILGMLHPQTTTGIGSTAG